MSKNFLAFDIGASNGRAMLGEFDGRKLGLKEIYRFPNEPITILDSIHWDVLRLFREVSHGLIKYSAESSQKLESIGLDTWGSDFGILDRKGHLLGNPNHYRDSRIDCIMEKVSKKISPRDMFYMTGNASIKYNTIYQLLSMCPNQSTFWDNAYTVLLMPDLLTYFLTGEKAIEFTNATTMQMMDSERISWHRQLLRKVDIPVGILPPIQPAGTLRGNLSVEMGEYTGAGKVPLIATATHDTAAAIAAIPGMDENSAFISSGTWSLVGAETSRLYINDEVYDNNFSNEGGVQGKNLLLRNTVGMWIIQECRREWDKFGGDTDYGSLLAALESANLFEAFIDPDNMAFSLPGSMPQKIREFCRKTGQKVPESKEQTARCIFESMALKYRWCIEKLEGILKRPLTSVHIVGGGCQNDMLNQFTANATGKTVVSGPVEATAAGNIMVQAMASGDVANLADIRKVIESTFQIRQYEPRETSLWDEAYHRFLELI